MVVVSETWPASLVGAGSLPGMAWPHIPPVGDRVWCGAVRVVGWSFVENCTVDASIFVVKLSRANGECLGTRSR